MDEGMNALVAWVREGEGASRWQVLTAVRFTLEELGALHPGRSVEVRVPPIGAVQILPGTTHRRGTPPAVVEMDAPTWLGLAVGVLSWEDALEQGRVMASGERTDLGRYLPIIDLPTGSDSASADAQASIRGTRCP